MVIKKRKTSGKKRVLSAAQKAALARGRKKAAANRRKKRTPRKIVAREPTKKRMAAKKRTTKRRKSPVSRNSEPLVIIHQGEKTMTKRKRRASTSKKPARRRRRRRSSYMSGFGVGSFKAKKLQGMLMQTTVSTASAIGGTMLLSKIPVQNTKVKATLPLIAGILVGAMARGKNAAVMNNVSNGLLIAGGLAVVKQFVPQFALSGENEMYRQNSMLGVNTDLLGINTDVVDDYSTDLSQY
jgi:hypothetical protein